jgi:hypothetical protein
MRCRSSELPAYQVLIGCISGKFLRAGWKNIGTGFSRWLLHQAEKKRELLAIRMPLSFWLQGGLT